MNETITEYLSQPTPALAVTSVVTVSNIMAAVPILINILTAIYLVFLVMKQIEDWQERRKKRKGNDDASN